MLTINDIPDDYRKGATDSENISRLASGVQGRLEEAIGPDTTAALHRFVRAGFLFHASEIGRVMIGSSSRLQDALQETSQFVNFSGGVLTSSALIGALDLTAAAFHRLYVGPPYPGDDAREADLKDFPGKKTLPAPARRWLENTVGDNAWNVLQVVRHQFVHRWFPLNITLSLGTADVSHDLEINGVRRRLGQLLDDGRAFVIDRMVAAGLVMNASAEARDLAAT
ncbi:MAG: hypothetical protein ACRDHU_00890 [Actinomycetota bacterium]